MMAARLALCSLLAVGGLADEGYEVLFESNPAAFEACSPLPNASKFLGPLTIDGAYEGRVPKKTRGGRLTS